LKWKHLINKSKNTTGENKISTEIENFELLSRKPISIAITILALPHIVHVFKFRFGKSGLKGVIQGVGTSVGWVFDSINNCQFWFYLKFQNQRTASSRC
jgi:hypothetical protein